MNIEIKVALEKNTPKGHLAKQGRYLAFRYVLADPHGTFVRGKDKRKSTVWVWEVKLGRLTEADFNFSSTKGDSGKTAVIKSESFKRMNLLYYDSRFDPYAKRHHR